MASAAVNSDMPDRSDIQIYQPDAQVGELKLWKPPSAVIAEAQEAAIALKRLIDGSDIKPVRFGNKEHLCHEHLEVLGHFFGYCTKGEWTKYVEYPDGNGGSTRGFEASALLIHERTGAVVGRAEAMCLDEEENWGEVAEYEWRDKPNGRGREKVEVGVKAKPLFQLRSMAQTRASAKCFRMKLAWVAVLAGYSQTPAEEMHDRTLPQAGARPDELPSELKRKGPEAETRPVTPSYERPAAPPRPQQQTSAPQSPRAPQRPAPAESVISEPQARRFYAIWKESGKTKAMVTEYLEDKFGITDDRKIPASRYKEACAWAMGDRF